MSVCPQAIWNQIQIARAIGDSGWEQSMMATPGCGDGAVSEAIDNQISIAEQTGNAMWQVELQTAVAQDVDDTTLLSAAKQEAYEQGAHAEWEIVQENIGDEIDRGAIRSQVSTLQGLTDEELYEYAYNQQDSELEPYVRDNTMLFVAAAAVGGAYLIKKMRDGQQKQEQ